MVGYSVIRLVAGARRITDGRLGRKILHEQPELSGKRRRVGGVSVNDWLEVVDGRKCLNVSFRMRPLHESEPQPPSSSGLDSATGRLPESQR